MSVRICIKVKKNGQNEKKLIHSFNQKGIFYLEIEKFALR